MKYYFKYVLERPEEQAPQAAMGSEGHAVLADFFRTGQWMIPASTYDWSLLKQLVIPANWEVIDVERQLNVELDGLTQPVELTGILDLVIRDGDDLWIVDHKFSLSNNLQQSAINLMGMQGRLYALLYELSQKQPVSGFYIHPIYPDWKANRMKNVFLRQALESGWKKAFLQELLSVLNDFIHWHQRMSSGEIPYRTVMSDCLYCSYLQSCNQTYYY
jgi:hypothetical protein